MNHKDKALRIAFIGFRNMANGITYSTDELRLLSDLCGVALPMKHKFTRQELDAIHEGTMRVDLKAGER